MVFSLHPTMDSIGENVVEKEQQLENSEAWQMAVKNFWQLQAMACFTQLTEELIGAKSSNELK
jgi:hypothetical protein